MSLGNLIASSIESFCIVIICIYLMDDAQKAMKKHKDEGASSNGTAMFIVAVLWMGWRFWFTICAVADYLGWRWP